VALATAMRNAADNAEWLNVTGCSSRATVHGGSRSGRQRLKVGGVAEPVPPPSDTTSMTMTPMTLSGTPVCVSMEAVDLPVRPPLEPMLAKAQANVPDHPGVWSYEPKWDGFLH